MMTQEQLDQWKRDLDREAGCECPDCVFQRALYEVKKAEAKR